MLKTQGRSLAHLRTKPLRGIAGSAGRHRRINKMALIRRIHANTARRTCATDGLYYRQNVFDMN